jgi:geranylgeranyl diphosphate synthase type I
MDTLAPPLVVADVARVVDRRLQAFLDAELRRWTGLDPALAEPIAALEELMAAGGKRLRPALCHLAFVGCGGRPDDPVVADAGAALEFLHSFALIHDDVMDGSDRRRGRRSVHRSFSDLHEAMGWKGEGRRFGEGVAILVGDLAFVYADCLMEGANSAARQVFDQLRIELQVGQYLDLVATSRKDPDYGLAQRISVYKSGKYTVERPLHLGAALAGRFDEAAAALSDFGLPLGEAFQLRDDLLGVFGDGTRTGKPVGDDLRAGKPTLLYTVAVERATGPSARLLAAGLAGELDDEQLADLRAVLTSTGALDAVEQRIAACLDESLEALERSPLLPAVKDDLAALARFIVNRKK